MGKFLKIHTFESRPHRALRLSPTLNTTNTLEGWDARLWNEPGVTPTPTARPQPYPSSLPTPLAHKGRRPARALAPRRSCRRRQSHPRVVSAAYLLLTRALAADETAEEVVADRTERPARWLDCGLQLFRRGQQRRQLRRRLRRRVRAERGAHQPLVQRGACGRVERRGGRGARAHLVRHLDDLRTEQLERLRRLLGRLIVLRLERRHRPLVSVAQRRLLRLALVHQRAQLDDPRRHWSHEVLQLGGKHLRAALQLLGQIRHHRGAHLARVRRLPIEWVETVRWRQR
eukprot:scaffold60103_cov71-Phaeocystis_antarctica.AAC.1